MSAIPPSRICADTLAWDCHAKKLLATPLRLQRYEKILDYTSFEAGFCKINLFCTRNERKWALTCMKLQEENKEKVNFADSVHFFIKIFAQLKFLYYLCSAF